MPGNLRSIVAQVTGIRGSVGSSRKFSSTNGSEGGRDRKVRFLTEMGFLVCAFGALENLLRITKPSESAFGRYNGIPATKQDSFSFLKLKEIAKANENNEKEEKFGF